MRKTFFMAVLVLAFSLVFLPVAGQAEKYVSTPSVAVDGRTLTPSQTGDIVNWVEIAQNGNYSLIVRTHYINRHNTNNNTYNVPTMQYVPFGSSTDYNASNLRKLINDWFNNRAIGGGDNLAANARLRDFTVQHSAAYAYGTSCKEVSMTDGLSRPADYQVGTGTDIAFALSYSEAANFLSDRSYTRFYMVNGKYVAELPSSAIAKANWKKINLPYVNAVTGIWLRNPGDTANSVAHIDASGRNFQQTFNYSNFVYPAVWVESGIFGTGSAAPVEIANVIPVDGRILTPEMTGDNVNWIEIATNGESSLIVRANYINRYSVNGNYLNNPACQFVNYGPKPDYGTSYVRAMINGWFNGKPMAFGGDVLPMNARIRDFSMQHNAIDKIGTTCDLNKSVTDGLSTPARYQVGIGNDIAFALSFSEAENYISNTSFWRNYFVNGQYISNRPSPPIAQANWKKITLPGYSVKVAGMWLRTAPGDASISGGAIDSTGRNFQNHISDPSFVYPAMWVGVGIFDLNHNGTINIVHQDIDTGETLMAENITVPAGAYGPYEPEYFAGYDYVGLDPDSAPVEGVIKNKEVISIVFQYREEVIVPTYTIVYLPGDGTGNGMVITGLAYGDKHRALNTTQAGVKKPWWNFDYWCTNPTGVGGEKYYIHDTIIVQGDLILYAIWYEEG